MSHRRHFRTVWISDLHLGSSSANADRAAAFLKHIQADTLYLVGDIIDMWRLKQRWHFPASHSRVIRRVLKMAEHGTRVIFIPGNHDEAARAYEGLEFGGVQILREAIHHTADGRRLLVIHGDEFDRVCHGSPLLSKLGGAAYDSLVQVNRLINRYRERRGKPYVAFSQSIKARVKRACTYMSDFESSIAEEVLEHDLHGVICGHIHKVDARRRDDGLWYYNCGDWVESCTALAEDDEGQIRIVDGISFTDSYRDHTHDDIEVLLEAPPISERLRNRKIREVQESK